MAPEDFAPDGGRGARRTALIRLGDVAAVRDGTEEPRTLALFNGRDAVGIEIKKTKGYSTTDVAREADREGGRAQPHAAGGRARSRSCRTPAMRVAASVANVQSHARRGRAAHGAGGLPVPQLVALHGDHRASRCRSRCCASFIAVWAFGFTLNTMSLLGLSLAIGILIDDAIVVRENIVRHVEMGKDHFTAAA